MDPRPELISSNDPGLASVQGGGSAASYNTEASMPTTSIPADQILAPAKNLRPTSKYRAGSKKARLVDLLSPAKGVTVDHLAATLGWLPHTTRAALTGLKKDGVLIEKLPPLKGANQSRYRLAREG